MTKPAKTASPAVKAATPASEFGTLTIMTGVTVRQNGGKAKKPLPAAIETLGKQLGQNGGGVLNATDMTDQQIAALGRAFRSHADTLFNGRVPRLRKGTTDTGVPVLVVKLIDAADVAKAKADRAAKKAAKAAK